VIIQVRVNRRIVAQVDKLARECRTTRSELVRHAISFCLSDERCVEALKQRTEVRRVGEVEIVEVSP
jgi:metal-responsive CopG/Arc/MetJ family transcriptional regulator